MGRHGTWVIALFALAATSVWGGCATPIEIPYADGGVRAIGGDASRTVSDQRASQTLDALADFGDFHLSGGADGGLPPPPGEAGPADGGSADIADDGGLDAADDGGLDAADDGGLDATHEAGSSDSLATDAVAEEG